MSCALATSCAEVPQSPTPRDEVPIVADYVADDAVFSTADRWRFAGGLTVDRVRIGPTPLSAGQAVEVRLQVGGARGDIVGHLEVQPPRPGSRQVALGGVGARPAKLPPDPRTGAVAARVVDGPWVASVPLSTPWHPRQALVTLRLEGEGRTIVATDGPRTADGVAILGLVDVHTQPTHVVAARAPAPTIDGVLDDPAWAAPGTTLVGSLDGEPWSGKAGEVRLAWDDTHLFASAQFEDRDVWSTLTEQDDPLWKEEVFELFVFGEPGTQRYLELQVSPRGVTFDAKFASYRKGDESWDSTWQTAVDLQGALDNRKDRDRGWSVEVAVPWSEICSSAPVQCPPRVGTRLRVNAFRFERPAKGATVGLALSPTRKPDFHASANAAILELGPEHPQ